MPEKLTGEIRADCAYTAREFSKRSGIGLERLHTHVRVRRMANKRFVVGAEFIQALLQLSGDVKGGES